MRCRLLVDNVENSFDAPDSEIILCGLGELSLTLSHMAREGQVLNSFPWSWPYKL